ncbi:MAG: hypothetical protein IPG59_22390 [Candidatus Melainabacteria bacterium]|nr:MAG: hypothetical protein IPG59_22390 [Candidatus Melainabacteria bacterium]
MKAKSSIFILILLACTLPLVSCSQSKVSNTDVEVVVDEKEKDQTEDESKKESLDQSKDVKEVKETGSLRRSGPEFNIQKMGDYNVKMKSGTKTLKGSVDLGREHEELMHIDIKPDAKASLFQPDIFGPEKLMVIQVQNSDSIFEYMIVPLDSDKPKVDKTFTTFNSEPEIVVKPKNGEFTVAFQEPFPGFSGARMVAPCVALKYSKGKLALDKKIMKERASEAELGDTASIKAAFEVHGDSDDVPAELVDEIVSRYYIGKAKEAREFFDKAWPKNHKGKAKAWQTIMDELKQSPYWSQIKAMNKL